MDYFIQFEDGSDGYLSHHGVLGMKWGVRNAETLRRYANEGGKKPTKRQVKSAIRQHKKQYKKETGGKAVVRWTDVGPRTAKVAEEHRNALKTDAEYQKASKKYVEAVRAQEKANERSLMAEDYYDRLMKEDSGATDSQKRKAKQAYIQAEAKRMAADKKYYKAKETEHQHNTRIAEAYVDRYENAAVRDLGFDNVKAGKALLNEYGLMYKATNSNLGSRLRYEWY